MTTLEKLSEYESIVWYRENDEEFPILTIYTFRLAREDGGDACTNKYVLIGNFSEGHSYISVKPEHISYLTTKIVDLMNICKVNMDNFYITEYEYHMAHFSLLVDGEFIDDY